MKYCVISNKIHKNVFRPAFRENDTWYKEFSSTETLALDLIILDRFSFRVLEYGKIQTKFTDLSLFTLALLLLFKNQISKCCEQKIACVTLVFI